MAIRACRRTEASYPIDAGAASPSRQKLWTTRPSGRATARPARLTLCLRSLLAAWWSVPAPGAMLDPFGGRRGPSFGPTPPQESSR